MKVVLKTLMISIIGLSVVGGAGYWFLQGSFGEGGNDGEDISAVAEQIELREGSNANGEVSESTEAADDEGADMLESKVQIYLHQMTHQKIVATEKHGAVEMTQENIKNMLKIVRENYDFYENGDFYEQTLSAWEQGDFSNAVSVHNTIWTWHNGTVGRATGVMSAEQEQKFVEDHFR